MKKCNIHYIGVTIFVFKCHYLWTSNSFFRKYNQFGNLICFHCVFSYSKYFLVLCIFFIFFNNLFFQFLYLIIFFYK